MLLFLYIQLNCIEKTSHSHNFFSFEILAKLPIVPIYKLGYKLTNAGLFLFQP